MERPPDVWPLEGFEVGPALDPAPLLVEREVFCRDCVLACGCFGSTNGITKSCCRS